MRYLVYCLILLLATSCFLMPLGAPHYHSYKPVKENEFVDRVDVFDTPRIKTYHFKAPKNLSIKGCSIIFEDDCETFEYKKFFETYEYQIHVRIKDRKFLKLLKKDTLKLFINDKEMQFVPVLKN